MKLGIRQFISEFLILRKVMEAVTEQTVRRFYDALNQKGSPEIVHDVISPVWTVHPPLPGSGSDVKRYLTTVSPIFEGLPDFHTSIDDMLIANNTVAVRGHVNAAHDEPLFGVPATGKKVSYLTCNFYRVEAGKVVESWHVEDWLSVLIQIDVLQMAMESKQ